MKESKYGVDEKGLFAVEKIYKGEELIYEYDPLVEEWPFYPDNDKRGKYTKAELFKLIENNPKLSKLIYYQAYNVDDDLFNLPFKYAVMDSDNVDDCEKRFPHTLFINHSCDPNIGFIEVTKCYALRDIDIGEEIAHNYGCIMTKNPFQVGLKCQCGSKEKCQQILRMDFYKDPIWRQENERYCFSYVKKKIQELLYNNETIAKTTIVEQQMSMTDASMFWLGVLHGYKLDRSLPLPFDRYRLVDEDRTGRGISVFVDFGEDLSHYFLHYASSMNIELEHLVFAIYYAFMFKLTNGETDLCVAVNIDSRHKDEFKTAIGLFGNIVPLRCQLDPHWSFRRLIEHVCEIIASTMKYSYFPLKRILAQHSNASKPAFLDILFEFLSNENVENKILFDDSRLHAMSMTSIRSNDEEIMSNFDFSLTMQHNSNTNQLSCTINASLDLFNRNTIEKVGQRFHSICKQLFTSTHDQTNQSIYELSLVMPDEILLKQSMNNTQVSFTSSTCIHQEFVYQVMKHPQKLAVELDDQSLTYSELLHYVQVLSLTIVNEYHVLPGEVVCQCVERSLSMVIGIMGIEIAGGVYCPLSPRDPQHRLHGLVEQTQCRLVLAHHSTTLKFSSEIVSCNLDLIWNVDHINSSIIMDRLLDIVVTTDDIAYIVFTSGSTGTSKGVQIRHRNLLSCIDSLVRLNLFTNKDTMIQMASCSYDVHVQEIIGTLIAGSTIIMLHPQGNMDLDYITKMLNEKQVSYLQCVPAYVNILLEFLQSHSIPSFGNLRNVDIGGEASTVQLMDKLYTYLPQTCSVWNIYGPAETTVDCTGYIIVRNLNMISIPMGRPLLNYRCMIMNEYLQSSITGEEGELFIGGVGVFAGYLGRNDLTAKALVEIDGEVFYRTGDLVRMENNGLLHYQGRKDHQVKLRGQRIELGEIERCLLDITSISACVVIKWNDDYLVAYVQSSDIHEEQLRQHCQSHLPSHMIPSFFIILEKLPLNANGKVDRKYLPIQKTSFHSPGTIHHQHVEPRNELEIYIHSLWCQILCYTRISIDTNFFGIGGHSLLLIQLYQNYKMTLNIDATKINISRLFEYTTIADHARLIHQSIDDPETYQKLSVIHDTQETSIRERVCLSSQENIILVADELSRYEPFPVTEIQLAYLVGREGIIDLGHASAFVYSEYDFSSTFNIECFERALNYLIQRHEALRLIFPSHTEQKILKTVPYYSISILNLDDVQSSQKHLIERREQLSHQIRPADQWPLFDFQMTRFISDDGYNIRLHFGFDILILDFWSTNLVLYELNQLYCNRDVILAELKLSYRDYIVAEQQWKHTTTYSNDRQYWINRLKSFPLGPNLPLQCLPNEIHVQRHCNAATILDQSLWQKLRKRITDHGLTPAGFLASIYALVLSKWSDNKHFALNLPVFNRLPIHPQVNQIAGDFTTVIPLEINSDK
ncbi:unnamed protein product, partial [Adineta steineri]